MSPREWINKCLHLPYFLRDFHEQKDVFKWIHSKWVGPQIEQHKQENKYSTDYLEGVSWVQAQIYVIDHFLRFMACHGYTLQKSRKKFDYCSIEETIKAFNDEQAAIFKKMLEERHKPDDTQEVS